MITNIIRTRCDQLVIPDEVDFIARYKHYHERGQVGKILEIKDINDIKEITRKTIQTDANQIKFTDLGYIFNYWIIDVIEEQAWFKIYLEQVFDSIFQINLLMADEQITIIIVDYFSKIFSGLCSHCLEEIFIKPLREFKEFENALEINVVASFCDYAKFQEFINKTDNLLNLITLPLEPEYKEIPAPKQKVIEERAKINEILDCLNGERFSNDIFSDIGVAGNLIESYNKLKENIMKANFQEYIESLKSIKHEMDDWKSKCGNHAKELEELRKNNIMQDAENLNLEWNGKKNQVASLCSKFVKPTMAILSNGSARLDIKPEILRKFAANPKDVSISDIDDIFRNIKANIERAEKNQQKKEKLLAVLSSEKRIKEIKETINERDQIQEKRKANLDSIISSNLHSMIEERERIMNEEMEQKNIIEQRFKTAKEKLVTLVESDFILMLDFEKFLNKYYFKMVVTDLFGEGKDIGDILEIISET